MSMACLRPSVGVELEQAGRRVDDHAPALDVDLGDDRGDERHQAPPPAGQRSRRAGPAPARSQAGHGAELSPAGVDGLEADELVLVPRVLVVDVLDGSRRRRTDGCRAAPRPQCGRDCPRTPAARCRCAGGRRAASAPAGTPEPATASVAKPRAGHEARCGVVGVGLHGHLTAQAVRLADPGDEQLDPRGPILSGGQDVAGMPGGGLPAYPVVRCVVWRSVSGPVGVDDVDPDGLPAGERTHRRCAGRWRCDPSDRSRDRGPRGGPGPRGPHRGAGPCVARRRRPCGRRCP